MRWTRSVQRYGRTPEPVTAYQKAGQVWDERIGSARVQAQSWRWMAFGGLLLSGGLAGGLLWQSLQSRVVPYVVEVDALGAARAVAPAVGAARPTDPQIAWHLGRFVKQVRSVSLDPVLMREQWLEAYELLTPRAKLFVDAYARAADPFASPGERTVSVAITSIVRASDRSFQVEWTESAFERGSPAGRSRWTAILTVMVRPPRTADALRRNPLGIHVDGIDWSRQLDPPAPARAPSPIDPTLTGISQ